MANPIAPLSQGTLLAAVAFAQDKHEGKYSVVIYHERGSDGLLRRVELNYRPNEVMVRVTQGDVNSTTYPLIDHALSNRVERWLRAHSGDARMDEVEGDLDEDSQ
ncbi:MAG: hypothetical protein L0332_25460 [Chloroflexi bacterium]|nr:hypothetical protein [Chloroflexota bacterium]MCI0730046.1 hypothetical protein [Chloroflexota bacterium]